MRHFKIRGHSVYFKSMTESSSDVTACPLCAAVYDDTIVRRCVYKCCDLVKCISCVRGETCQCPLVPVKPKTISKHILTKNQRKKLRAKLRKMKRKEKALKSKPDSISPQLPTNDRNGALTESDTEEHNGE